MPDFLFVAGCARSGTSALTRMLASSPHIIVSAERYNLLTRPGDFTLTPAHFERERFFDVREGDTHYRDFESVYAGETQGRFDHFDAARFVGDKKPAYYLVYDELLQAFPGARVVFIYREPVAVASSYQARLVQGVRWRPRADFQMAVTEWNESLERTAAAIERYPGQILPIDYDSVFMSDLPLDPLVRFLGLDSLDLPQNELESTRTKAWQLEQAREDFLTPKQMDWVKLFADRGALVSVDAHNPFAPVRSAADWTGPPWRRLPHDLRRLAGTGARRALRPIARRRRRAQQRG